MVTTRSQAAKKQKVVPLNAVPVNMLKTILTKIPNLELSRMRRTCKRVNSFVEKNNTLFSTRIMEKDSHWVYLDLMYFDDLSIVLRANGKRIIFMEEAEIRKVLAGFTINKVNIAASYSYQGNFHEALQKLRSLRLSCFALYLHRVPPNVAIEILETMEYVAITTISFKGNEEISAQNLLDFGNGRLAHSIELEASSMPLDEVPMEILKKFRRIDVSYSKTAFLQQLIETLQSTNDCGNWEELSVCFTDNEEEMSKQAQINMPFKKIYSNPLCQKFAQSVFVKQLFSKQLVVTSCAEYYYAQHVFKFIEKNSEALTAYLLKAFEIENPRKKLWQDITNADLAEKGKILLEEVNK